RLIWDMLHEGVNWFDARGDAQTSSRVVVVGSPAAAEVVEPAVAPLTFDAPLPSRRVLWAIALQLIAEHPLLGIGLDNYRLTYSRYLTDDPLPGTALDQTIHSNNWYLETLVSVGMLGTVPFALWLLALLWSIIRLLRRPNIDALQVASAAGLLAFIIHGLLDYFLLFNATALLFWTTAALWLIFDYDNNRL
ncbi:MAG: O-antigen ligase family protein, partial [Candidatus Promineofilum sp.]|nr:O-antigen ligase family protein [Promineifilum sp.]